MMYRLPVFAGSIALKSVGCFLNLSTSASTSSGVHGFGHTAAASGGVEPKRAFTRAKNKITDNVIAQTARMRLDTMTGNTLAQSTDGPYSKTALGMKT